MKVKKKTSSVKVIEKVTKATLGKLAIKGTKKQQVMFLNHYLILYLN